MFTKSAGARGARRHGHRVSISALATVTGVVMALGAAFGAASRANASILSAKRVGRAPVAGAAIRLGPLAGSTRLQIDVALQPRNPAALANYATDVSTPGNALYRHYIARGQFAGRFGPTRTAIEAVTRSLESEGLPAGRISGDHLSISISASASELSKAFSIGFDRYRVPGGRIAYANTKAPLFAGDVAPYIQGVIGLDSLSLPKRLGLQRVPVHREVHSTPQVVTGGPQPCSAAVNAGPANDAFTADQLASAYRFSNLYGAGDEGSGVTVALYELEPNLTTDISKYQSCYGTSTSVTYTKVDGGAGSGAGEGEAALDIEDVIGLAPKAAIDVYQAPNSNTGAIENYEAIVDNDTAQVVSTSWGDCESTAGSSVISQEGTLFQQAATQGQSIFAAAGDSGSEDCGTNALAVDDPASQPYVTGVGGTEITALGPAPTQNVWNEAANGAGAGGGGVSSSHTMPSYQSGAPASLKVINANSSGTPCKAASGSYCREVPDVSADADPYSGYVIYYDGSWTGIGGTSAAAPLWAAFTALTDASSTCGGKAIGFANPVLYSAAASAYSADFNDITSGNNDYTGTNGGLYPAGTDYDMASGLGTPNGAGLPATLCGGSSTGNTVTVTNPGTQTTTVGTSVSLQISGTDSGGLSLTYSATGLPAGLSISSSGLITGAPTTVSAPSVTVTAKDSTGASGSATFTWNVTAKTSCTAAQLLGNPGFESGVKVWSATADVILDNSEAEGAEVAEAGKWFAWLDGYGVPHTDTLSQSVAVPAGCSNYTLSYYQHIDTSEDSSTAVDTLKLQVLNSSGGILATLSTYSNLNANNGYKLISVNMSAYAGETIKIKWTGTETDTGGGTTDFTLDTTAFKVS
jgi:subtilase family serine protease